MPVMHNCLKCKKTQELVMDKATKKVYCLECNDEVNVNHFQKVQLESLKQYREDKKEHFSVKCNDCGSTGKPKILKDKVICFKCNGSLSNISDIYKNMIKIQLKEEK